MKLFNTIKVLSIGIVALFAGNSFAQGINNPGQAGKQQGSWQRDRGPARNMVAGDANCQAPERFFTKGRMAGPGQRNGDHGWKLLTMTRRLNLTDAQEQQILALSQSFRNDMAALREASSEVHDAMRAVKTAETFDEKALRATLESAQSSRIEAQVLRARYHVSLRNLLTDEQKTQLEQVMERNRHRGGDAERKGRWQMRRGA